VQVLISVDLLTRPYLTGACVLAGVVQRCLPLSTPPLGLRWRRCISTSRSSSPPREAKLVVDLRFSWS
jgi:hypothetical protein